MYKLSLSNSPYTHTHTQTHKTATTRGRSHALRRDYYWVWVGGDKFVGGGGRPGLQAGDYFGTKGTAYDIDIGINI